MKKGIYMIVGKSEPDPHSFSIGDSVMFDNEEDDIWEDVSGRGITRYNMFGPSRWGKDKEISSWLVRKKDVKLLQEEEE